MSAEPKRAELTEAERADLDSWAAPGIYLCDASDPCAGYHDQRPGHEHENLFDAVAELIAAREAAARREALLEAADAYSDFAVYLDTDGHRSMWKHGLTTPEWLRKHAAALAEPERDEEGGND